VWNDAYPFGPSVACYIGREKPPTWQYKGGTCTVGVLLRTPYTYREHTLTQHSVIASVELQRRDDKNRSYELNSSISSDRLMSIVACNSIYIPLDVIYCCNQRLHQTEIPAMPLLIFQDTYAKL
jgi:hypothetical protein